VKLGVSLATSGKNITVVFGEEELIVDYGRSIETFKVTYTKNETSKAWSFCLNEGNNCFPAIFLDEKKNRVSFPLYGVSMSFIKQTE
jgi:hypothetical protein